MHPLLETGAAWTDFDIAPVACAGDDPDGLTVGGVVEVEDVVEKPYALAEKDVGGEDKELIDLLCKGVESCSGPPNIQVV